MREKIKILFLAANPSTTTRLNLGTELRQIEEKLAQASKAESFELLINAPTGTDDLRRLLLTHKPDIVHFSGHGGPEQKIILEDSQGREVATDTKSLVDAFRPFKDDVRLVLLNACMTNSQATALGKVIDYTIGIEGLVADEAAITFAGAFYLALVSGRSVEEAYASAKAEIMLRGLPRSGGFKFLVREGVDPSMHFPPVLEQRDHQESPLAIALRKLVDGDASPDEIRSIRKAVLDGNLILEQADEAVEGEVTFLEPLAASTSTKTLRGEVHPNTYHALQERLFPQPRGIGPPLPGLIMVGRENALAEIKKLLSPGPTKTNAVDGNLVVLRGWPGVGKTTLAGAVGRDPEVLSAFPDGVLWTSLDREPVLMSKIAEWGRALGTDEMLRSPTIDEAVAKLATMLKQRRMLLIVDDVWEPEHALPFITAAASSKCSVLVTTRLPQVASKLTADPKRIYVLPVLTEADSLTLLRYLAGDVVERYPEECRELVNALGNLPLALHVVGRLLKTEARSGFNVVELIKKIREDASLLAERVPLDRAEETVIPTVGSLFKSSTDELDEFTRECFAFLAPFAPRPATFDSEALKAIWQVDDPTPIIRKLVGHGLLEPVGERFQMHELLLMHARSLLA